MEQIPHLTNVGLLYFSKSNILESCVHILDNRFILFFRVIIFPNSHTTPILCSYFFLITNIFQSYVHV